MATRLLTRSQLTTTTQSLISSFSRSISTASLSTPLYLSLRRLGPLAVAAANFRQVLSPAAGNYFQVLTTRRLSSSPNDRNPNSSDRYFTKTVAHGCDYKHWRVIIDKPEGNPTRDELIDHYIKTLAKVIGSEEEARMKMYSVYTNSREHYEFGALVSKEVYRKLTELENVLLVFPDSYKDVQKKTYGGEPFINGVAVPYDPKYYEHQQRPLHRDFGPGPGPVKTEVCLVNLESVTKVGGPYSFN